MIPTFHAAVDASGVTSTVCRASPRVTVIFDGAAVGRLLHQPGELARAAHPLAVELDHHVALAQSGLGRRAAVVDAVDAHAGGPGALEVADHDADLAAPAVEPDGPPGAVGPDEHHVAPAPAVVRLAFRCRRMLAAAAALTGGDAGHRDANRHREQPAEDDRSLIPHRPVSTAARRAAECRSATPSEKSDDLLARLVGGRPWRGPPILGRIADSMDSRAAILERAEREGVRFLRLQFTDILGVIKNVEVPDRQFAEALDGGVMFDGSSIEGFVRIEESDMYLKPDLDTFQVLPWPDASGARVGGITCDIANPDGTPFDGCPRSVLKRAIARARAMDFRMVAGPEAEFFLFQRKDGGPSTATHDTAGYFDLAPVDQGEDVRREIVLALEQMGFLVEAAHHEVAPGQHEVDFRYDDVLRTADNVSTFRFVVKNVAHRNGLHATFMPKPIYGVNGSGMHTHQALFKGDGNAFFDADARVAAEPDLPALRRRPPQARPRLLRHHQPAGELVQAAGAGPRGARPRSPGRRRTAARWCACRRRAARRRGSSCACPIRPAIRTWRWR